MLARLLQGSFRYAPVTSSQFLEVLNALPTTRVCTRVLEVEQCRGLSTGAGPSEPGPSPPQKARSGPRLVLASAKSKEVHFQEGIIHVHNTLNNCLLTLTDLEGMPKAFTSSGCVGYKNAAKASPLAAERAAEDMAGKALKLGYNPVVVKTKGLGKSKLYVLQQLQKCGIKVTEIQDITPIPYNGCRLKRKRRV